MHIDLEFTFYFQHNKNIGFPDNCLLVVPTSLLRDTCYWTPGPDSWLFGDTALASLTQNSRNEHTSSPPSV